MKVLRIIAVFSLLAYSAYAQDNPTRFEREHGAKVNALIEELGSEDPIVSRKAGELLERIVRPSDLNTLVTQLKKGNRVEIQEMLARAIARTRDTRATKGLLFEITHGSPRSKRAAVDALGYVGDDFAVTPILKTLEKSTDLKFHLNAINAWARIGTERSFTALRSYKAAVDMGGRTLFRENADKKVLPKALDTALRVLNGYYERGETDFEIKQGIQQRLRYDGVEYLFYQAATRYSKSTKPIVLVCIHGMARRTDYLYRECQDFAQRHGAALVIPIFDTWNFPDYETFNCHGRRSDVFLLQLLDFLIEKQDLESKEIYMMGINHGGDFVHRFAFAYPRRMGRVLAVPTDFISFSYDKVFPDGFTPNPYCSGLAIREEEAVQVDMALMRGRVALSVLEDYVTRLAKRGRQLGITSHIYTPTSTIMHEENFYKAMRVLFRYNLPYKYQKSTNEDEFPL